MRYDPGLIDDEVAKHFGLSGDLAVVLPTPAGQKLLERFAKNIAREANRVRLETFDLRQNFPIHVRAIPIDAKLEELEVDWMFEYEHTGVVESQYRTIITLHSFDITGIPNRPKSQEYNYKERYPDWDEVIILMKEKGYRVATFHELVELLIAYPPLSQCNDITLGTGNRSSLTISSRFDEEKMKFEIHGGSFILPRSLIPGVLL